MSWWQRMAGRPRDSSSHTVTPAIAPVPTSDDIVLALDRVREQIAGKVPGIVAARIQRIDVTVRELMPRMDRVGTMTRQGHTVVATAMTYLPEAVEGYLRLPRDFADRRPVYQGKTSLMILCDQLDLLDATLGRISDAISREDANALVAHGAFLAEKFESSSFSDAPTPATSGGPQPPDVKMSEEP